MKNNQLYVRVYGDEILKQKSENVIEMTTEFKDFINELISIMYEKDGIGIAAPQVGVLKRVVIVDCEHSKTGNKNPIVLINPEFLEYSGDQVSEEGCLSVPGVYANVNRFNDIKLKYLDIDMKEHILTANDTFSIVLQHEIDHLDGILFVDKLNPIKRMALSFKLNRINKAT